ERCSYEPSGNRLAHRFENGASHPDVRNRQPCQGGGRPGHPVFQHHERLGRGDWTWNVVEIARQKSRPVVSNEAALRTWNQHFLRSVEGLLPQAVSVLLRFGAGSRRDRPKSVTLD